MTFQTLAKLFYAKTKLCMEKASLLFVQKHKELFLTF